MEWLVHNILGCKSVVHYLYDFLCISPGDGNVCLLYLLMVEQVAVDLGVPLAPRKSKGPSMVISFLGITIDMVYMECWPPDEVGRMAKLRKVQLKELQSLLGK